jgi:small conductance mechanosensitive channel
MNYIDIVKKTIYDKLPDIITSLFILLLFIIVANVINNIITKDNNIISDETEYISKNLIFYQIGNIVFYIILVVGFIFTLINLGFNTSTIITILASIGIAFGIALQGTLNNIISGIIIAINNTYSINDMIIINNVINDNSITGQVIDFNLYTTQIYNIKTKNITIIPNSIIQNNLITNITRSTNLEKKI